VHKEHSIVSQILTAQKDPQAADALIEQYLPFIKSETAKFLNRFPDDGQEELSIAMFAFYEALMAYRSGKGTFLKLAAITIHNRLIDYYRKEKRHGTVLSLNEPSAGEDSRTLEEQIEDRQNEIDALHDQTAAQKEIEEFTEQLVRYGLTLSDIADNCPKQERTLSACMEVLDYARQTPALLDQLIRTKKLPLAQLADGVKVERKTMERHRKYLVAILLAYTNGFEIIRGHLSLIKRKEVSRV